MTITYVFLNCLCLIDKIKRDVNIYIKMIFVALFGLLSLKLCMRLFLASCSEIHLYETYAQATNLRHYFESNLQLCSSWFGTSIQAHCASLTFFFFWFNLKKIKPMGNNLLAILWSISQIGRENTFPTIDRGWTDWSQQNRVLSIQLLVHVHFSCQIEEHS